MRIEQVFGATPPFRMNYKEMPLHADTVLGCGWKKKTKSKIAKSFSLALVPIERHAPDLGFLRRPPSRRLGPRHPTAAATLSPTTAATAPSSTAAAVISVPNQARLRPQPRTPLPRPQPQSSLSPSPSPTSGVPTPSPTSDLPGCHVDLASTGTSSSFSIFYCLCW